MNNRNYGIDLLRIVSMFYVVLLHVLTQGGVMQDSLQHTAKGIFVNYIYLIAVCAVDCFALISGYVGYKEECNRLRIARYLNIWLQVVFYSLLVPSIYHIITTKDVALKSYLKGFCPVTSDAYWYFTAYTGLFFIAPLINAAVQKIDNRKIKQYIFISFAVFSVYASFASIIGNPFNLELGYSVIWLVILYFIGAGIKKTGLFSGVSVKLGIIIIVMSVSFGTLCILCSKIVIVPRIIRIFIHRALMCYTSPMIVIIATLHLLIFAKMKVSPKVLHFIEFSAPGTFAVYLINTQEYFFEFFMKDRFLFLANPNETLIKLLIVLLGFSAFFVIVAVAIDYLRRKLFQIIGLNKLIIIVETTATECMKKFIDI